MTQHGQLFSWGSIILALIFQVGLQYCQAQKLMLNQILKYQIYSPVDSSVSDDKYIQKRFDWEQVPVKISKEIML